MSDELLKTPFHAWHAEAGGRLVDFAGWEMPVQYASIIEEHLAVRRAAGLFDIAHMGRLVFTGPDACGLLDRLVTNDVASIAPGRVRYALVTNERGGIRDDVLVYRFDEFTMLVVNASNRLKIVDWIEQQRGEDDVEVVDRTLDWAMLAIQGPRSVELVTPFVDFPVAEMKYYRCAEARIHDADGLVSRTGYTGEDGFELIVPAEKALELWQALHDRGTEVGLIACGLGSRDTLRLEAAMPLYGHELDEEIDPYTAGLDFAVKLDAAEFIGRDAVLAARDNPARRRRVGLLIEGGRIAREGAAVLLGDDVVGEVTSGTHSPTLERVIAMAYVAPRAAEENTGLEVDIRGRPSPATVVPLPFYRRT